MHSSSPTTCHCSIFKLFPEDSCKIQRAQCLPLVQLMSVEEGGKDEVHAIYCQVRSDLTRLWYAYRNALAGFVCIICLLNTKMTGTD